MLRQAFLNSSEFTILGLLVSPGRDRPMSNGTLSGYVPSNSCIYGVENYLERPLSDISLVQELNASINIVLNLLLPGFSHLSAFSEHCELVHNLYRSDLRVSIQLEQCLH